MKENNVFKCPEDDFTCPYYTNGNCSMYPDADPREECDEAGMFYAFYEDDILHNEIGFDPYLGCYTDDC